jgi:hypothetical protein
VDSGFVVGLKKILQDYGVTNFTFIPVGGNRLPYVQHGYNIINGQNISIAAAVLDNTAPYLTTFTYPIVNLAQQAVRFFFFFLILLSISSPSALANFVLQEHFCPSQGTGYVAPTAWLEDAQNFADLQSYFRALVRAYNFISDPANEAAVKSYINSSVSTDTGIIALVYDDYLHNPATGLNPYFTPRKNGMKNIVCLLSSPLQTNPFTQLSSSPHFIHYLL